MQTRPLLEGVLGPPSGSGPGAGGPTLEWKVLEDLNPMEKYLSLGYKKSSFFFLLVILRSGAIISVYFWVWVVCAFSWRRVW
jgi:hypothetical protein